MSEPLTKAGKSSFIFDHSPILLFDLVCCVVLLVKDSPEGTELDSIGLADRAKGIAVNQRPPFLSQPLLWGLPAGNSLI